MPFIELRAKDQRELIPGYRVQFVHTDHMTLAYWEIAAGAELPEHAHPHEQVANVIEGEYELLVGGDRRILTPGTVAVIPPDTPHSGRAVTECRIIDAFYPLREDFL